MSFRGRESSNTYLCIFVILFGIYFVFYSTLDNIHMVSTSDFVNLIGYKRMQQNLIPSVDFYTPLGILNFYLFNWAYDINKYSANIIARIPAFILIISYLYSVRHYMNGIIVLLLGIFLMVSMILTTYSILCVPPVTYFYNYYIIVIVILSSLFLLKIQSQQKLSILDGFLLGISFVFCFLIKITGAIVLLPIIVYYVYLSRKNKYFIITILASILIPLIGLELIHPNYINSYFNDLQLASAVKTSIKLLYKIVNELDNIKNVLIPSALVVIYILFTHKHYRTFQSIFTLGLWGGALFGIFITANIGYGYIVFISIILIWILTYDKDKKIQKKYHINKIFALLIISIQLIPWLQNISCDIKNRLYKTEIDKPFFDYPNMYFTKPPASFINNYKDISILMDGAIEARNLGLFDNSSTIITLSYANYADWIMPQTQSRYPIYMTMNIEYNHKHFPKPQNVFKNSKYIVMHNPNGINRKNIDKQLASYLGLINNLWIVYSDYIQQNYKIIKTTDEILYWEKK